MCPRARLCHDHIDIITPCCFPISSIQQVSTRLARSVFSVLTCTVAPRSEESFGNGFRHRLGYVCDNVAQEVIRLDIPFDMDGRTVILSIKFQLSTFCIMYFGYVFFPTHQQKPLSNSTWYLIINYYIERFLSIPVAHSCRSHNISIEIIQPQVVIFDQPFRVRWRLTGGQKGRN